MKKSILTVILAAVICSITQTGFAADFVFKMAGIQVKKLPADIEKVRTICLLRYRKADGTTSHLVKESIFPVTQTQEGREVITGPFELVYENVTQRDSVFGYRCELHVYRTGAGWKLLNNYTSPTGQPWIDFSQYFKDHVDADHL